LKIKSIVCLSDHWIDQLYFNFIFSLIFISWSEYQLVKFRIVLDEFRELIALIKDIYLHLMVLSVEYFTEIEMTFGIDQDYQVGNETDH